MVVLTPSCFEARAKAQKTCTYLGMHYLQQHMYSKKHASFFYVKSDLKNIVQNALHIKGQIISKELFRVLKFSQKTNEQIRRSSENEFVCSFLGRI